MSHGPLTRREMLLATAGGLTAASLPLAGLAAEAPAAQLKGRIRQSASKWCYRGISLPDLCAFGKKIGLVGIDLLGPGDFKTLKEYGLVCTMTSCNSIGKGFNRTEHHEELIKNLRGAIEATAAQFLTLRETAWILGRKTVTVASRAGLANVICFSGNCQGMAKDEGLKNCAEGLKKIVGFAEEKKVVLCLEYLNSKNHRDYMADDSKWCFDLVKAVGSPNFKILYDIYHVAMMEAEQVEEGGKKVARHNIGQLIKDNIDAIGHFHTGGFPNRNEIDDTQLLDYPALMKVIAEAGYKGYVAHEFVPKNKNKLESLAQAVRICDV